MRQIFSSMGFPIQPIEAQGESYIKTMEKELLYLAVWGSKEINDVACSSKCHV